jgi:ankyrin repeat protein
MSLKLLIFLGAELEAEDNKGRTSLYHSILGKNLSCARLLLDAGANPNVYDQQRRMMPLHVAARRRDWKMAKLLWERDASLVAKSGKAPWHWTMPRGTLILGSS